MNRHSKYYRLNPVKGKLGKVNHKVVSDIKYDTFRRFNSYNVATKHAILGAVGKLLDEMVREDVGLYIQGSGPRKRPILIFVDGEWKVVWLPDPIAPYATPSDFSYKKIMESMERVAIEKVDASHHIVKLKGKDGVQFTLNVFGTF